MFIQTESTPNPETMKFLPSQDVMGEGKSLEITDLEAAAMSPLATRLFALDVVERVFLGSNFVSVTKTAGDWAHIKPVVLGAILEHFISGDPVLGETATGDVPDGHDVGEYDDETAEIVEQIIELLDTRVRPAVAQDGGDITFQRYEKGIVYLTMRGSCAGCPSSTMTLQSGIQNLLKHYIPEVLAVEPA